MTQSQERLVDGICHGSIELELAPRIKADYKEGRSGDDGYSTLLSGHSISKASTACAIYSAQEHLQQAIAECLASKHQIRQSELVVILVWFQEALTSLGAFAFSKGEATKHMFPPEFLAYMELRIQTVKNLLGPSTDFIIYEDATVLMLNKLRICSRDIERAFVAYWQSSEINRQMMRRPYLIKAMQSQAKVLNRCSSWLWAEARYEGYLAQINEKHWVASMPEFPKLS